MYGSSNLGESNRLEILALSLFPTGRYHDIQRRSYQTNITDHTLNLLDEATQGGQHISLNAVSKVAASIVAPSAATEGVVPIVHGWRTPRYVFLLKARTSSMHGIEQIAYYVGHTDHLDDAVSMNGLIDPNLQFHVNSVHRLRTMQRYQGGQVSSVSVSQNGAQQFLFNDGSLANLQNNQLGLYKFRPGDVFSSQNTLNALERAGALYGVNTVDTTGTLSISGETNRRSNNIPGQYLHTILKAYDYGISSTHANGLDEEDIVKEAYSTSQETSTFTDHLIAALRNSVYNIDVTGQFSWHDLMTVTPHIDQITTVFDTSNVSRFTLQDLDVLDQQYRGIYGMEWNAENTQHWNGSNIETVAATLLVQAVPAMMLENLLGEMRFSMTNQNTNGSITYTIHNAHVLDPMVDSVRSVNHVINRIMMELIPTITMNNEMPFFLLMDSSVHGDTLVYISLNGDNPVPFVMPTFADNAASPILSTSKLHYDNLTNDLYQTAKHVFRGASSQHHQPIITDPYGNPYGY